MNQVKSQALSVLLLEDDQDLRAAMAGFLEKRGYEVFRCGQCSEALKLIGRPGNGVHILLADLRLPDGEGLEVMRAGQRQNPDLLAAIMTGYASLETAVRAIRMGAYDYITKPFSFDEIEVLIRNMSDKIRLVQQNRAISNQVDLLHGKIEDLREEKLQLLQANRELQSGFARIEEKLNLIADGCVGRRGNFTIVQDSAERSVDAVPCLPVSGRDARLDP